jgi:Ca2+-binding RTX toxin-like protein
MRRALRAAARAGVVAAVVVPHLLLNGGTGHAAGNVDVSFGTLRVAAGAGDANDINITLSGGLYFVEDVVALVPGAGCIPVTAVKVACSGVSGIWVNGHDLDDKIKNSTATRSTLLGGNGQDQVTGGTGNDALSGDSGHDVLIGLDGNDSLRGADGDDQLSGGNGDDFLSGSTGTNIVDGGPGTDNCSGGPTFLNCP